MSMHQPPTPEPSESNRFRERIEAFRARNTETPSTPVQSDNQNLGCEGGDFADITGSEQSFTGNGSPFEGWPRSDLFSHTSNLASMALGAGTVLSAAVATILSIEEANAMKAGKKLSADAEREYDEFVKVLREGGPSHAFARMMLAQLQTRDLAQQMLGELRALWTPPEPLLKACKNYAYIVFFSPRIYSYRGEKLPGLVLDVMRKVGVSDLPGSQDLGRLTVVKTKISRVLTDLRYEVKSKLGESIYDADGEPIRTDIGTVLQNCIGATKVPVLVATLARLAFLRGIWAEEFRKQSTQVSASDQTERGTKKRKSKKTIQLKDSVDFWAIVDTQLKDARKEANSPEELAAIFKGEYENDILKYGNLSAPVTEAKDLDDWLQTVHNATALPENTGTGESGKKDT
ncbi:hypothetical protein PQX77_018410 [Marasmius sp. AFHP31]|nr:hypothetical protein PQX77_018410 [Marasmius sp. AFHP31]